MTASPSAHYGLTFVRESTIQHDSFTERAPRLGGLVEFYRSPEHDLWTDTGFNVPDTPRLAQLWWQNAGDAASGLRTAQEVMDSLCDQQEAVMARLERAGVQGDVGPPLDEPQDPQLWLDQPGAPWSALEDEKGEPNTIPYEELIRRWTERPSRPGLCNRTPPADRGEAVMTLSRPLARFTELTTPIAQRRR